MKRLALLLLALPLSACATPQQTAGAANCNPRLPGYDACAQYDRGGHVTLSHWDVVSGRGAFLASGAQASAASTGDPGYPAGSYGGH